MTDSEYSFSWLEKIIESCNNQFHIDCVDVLIELYKTKYNDEELLTMLQNARETKFIALHNILN